MAKDTLISEEQLQRENDKRTVAARDARRQRLRAELLARKRKRGQ